MLYFVLMFLISPCVTPLEANSMVVKLGEPWNVTCDTSNNASIRWFFKSALHFFNGARYDGFVNGDDNLYENVWRRYNISVYKNKSTLIVSNTDMNHSGLYYCIRDKRNIENKQAFKLNLIEHANIEIIKEINGNRTLQINLSYYALNIEPPVIKCYFIHETDRQYEINCEYSRNHLTTCTLDVMYLPQHESPNRCQMFSKDDETNLWMDEQLALMPDERVVYLEDGEAWNMTCVTPFQAPMKWKFHSVSSNETITSNGHLHFEKKFKKKYHFSVTDDNKTYTMVIPHVGTDQAGSYKCFHQSSDEFIEQHVKIVVLVEKNIETHNSESKSSLLMSVSYVGHNVPSPTFQCISSSKFIIKKNVKCEKNENQIHECKFWENFNINGDLPEVCQILFLDFVCYERDLARFYNTTAKNKFVGISLSIAIIAILIIIIVFLFRKKAYTKNNSDNVEDKEESSNGYDVPSDFGTCSEENTTQYERTDPNSTSQQNYSSLFTYNSINNVDNIDNNHNHIDINDKHIDDNNGNHNNHDNHYDINDEMKDNGNNHNTNNVTNNNVTSNVTSNKHHNNNISTNINYFSINADKHEMENMEEIIQHDEANFKELVEEGTDDIIKNKKIGNDDSSMTTNNNSIDDDGGGTHYIIINDNDLINDDNQKIAL